MSYRIQLVNVKEFDIDLDYVELKQFEPRILSILSRFDFTYLCPNLKKFSTLPTGMFHPGELSRDTMNEIIQQANAVQNEPTVPRARNIKHLVSYQGSTPTPVAAVEFFAQMFPDIEELVIYSRYNHFPVGSACERWPDLKLMRVNGEQY